MFRGGESGAYKIKTVLFLFVLGLLAAPRYYSKETRKDCSSHFSGRSCFFPSIFKEIIQKVMYFQQIDEKFRSFDVNVVKKKAL
jgi:hypothetical protein